MTINEKSIEDRISKIEHISSKKNNVTLGDFYSYIKKVISLIKHNKEKVKILIPIAIISILLMIYMITQTTINIINLNKEGSELNNLNYFNISLLEKNLYTKEDIKSIKTISDLITYNNDTNKEIERFQDYLTNLQAPLNSFTKNIFLPSLNIRKDPYMGDIDTNIIGALYLEKNPYDDIKLIQKRSNFFKDVGNNNEFNEISDIFIGDISEDEEFFNIPINIEFISNSKRSFLLLVEKLSTTSNKENISLINEFIYNMRENIKENKQTEIEKLKKEYGEDISEDNLIGYHLNDRVFNEKENVLIDDELINKTIRDNTLCNEENEVYCYYKFREKYRSIPSLAYTIGLEKNFNKTKNLKTFLKDLPPIIKIKKFTFDRDMEQTISNYENIQYKGEISLEIYGKSISNEEVSTIATLLGEKCLGEAMSPKNALNKIENTIINIGSITQMSTNNTNNLRELQKIIEDIDQKYDDLSNHKKTIKLFEIKRMLDDSNLCKI